MLRLFDFPKYISIFLLGLLFLIREAHGFVVPSLSGPVVDQARLLTVGQTSQIDEVIRQAAADSGVQIQVLLLKDLQQEPIESVAIQVFDRWKLGDEKNDNGFLLIASIAERKLRIEVGQGLEGVVPDVVAKRLINSITGPLYAKKKYFEGTLLTVEALALAAKKSDGAVFNVESFLQQKLNANELEPALADESVRKESADNIGPNDDSSSEKKQIPLIFVLGVLFILWLIILIISPPTALWILSMLLSGGRGGRGSGSDMGWSGGGGSSSGGGASGDW